MATIFPPFRSLAPRTALQWDANNTNLGGAVIDGNQANFAAIVGGEAVTISRAGGPATLITMLAGDISATLVAARINAAFPGLASVNSEGGVRLVDATSVGVTIISGVDQERLGLPAALARDATAGPLPTVRPDRVFVIDRTDLVSAPIAIPDGANRIALWIKTEGNDATSVGCALFAGFSNGTEGVMTTSVLQLVIAAHLEQLWEEESLQLSGLIVDQVYVPTVGTPGLGRTVAVELEVPPGATEFFVAIGAAEDSSSGNRAYSPATVSGGVIPGVR